MDTSSPTPHIPSFIILPMKGKTRMRLMQARFTYFDHEKRKRKELLLLFASYLTMIATHENEGQTRMSEVRYRLDNRTEKSNQRDRYHHHQMLHRFLSDAKRDQLL
eukprot:TRINITY_DN12796_c0_g1_i1.p1 TRINITY_DN12796_c0_g1~~TRINITY_DN12796_c0_g1_i1.p1  ORF type:complete len:106 (-),score=17.31 TRINITY_DN12796_c0_g1_i1:73-390(-)